MTVQGPVKKQQPDGMSHRGPTVCDWRFCTATTAAGQPAYARELAALEGLELTHGPRFVGSWVMVPAWAPTKGPRVWETGPSPPPPFSGCHFLPRPMQNGGKGFHWPTTAVGFERIVWVKGSCRGLFRLVEVCIRRVQAGCFRGLPRGSSHLSLELTRPAQQVNACGSRLATLWLPDSGSTQIGRVAGLRWVQRADLLDRRAHGHQPHGHPPLEFC